MHIDPTLSIGGDGTGHRLLTLCGGVLLWSSPAAVAHGPKCPNIEGGSSTLAEQDAEQRLRFLRAGMERAARAARNWTWAWASINAGFTVGQLAIATAVPKGRRTELWIGAVGSGVGTAAVVLAPLRVIRDRRALEKRFESRRPGDDPCVLLAEAERFLIRDARSEGFGTGPLAHAGNVLLNLGIGIATAVATHRHREAAFAGVAGIAVGEIQINTQPRRSVRLLERYRTGHLQPTRPGLSLRPGLTLGRSQIGASVIFSF